MEDQRRLLSTHGGASALERELLQCVPNIGPPHGAKSRTWDGLAVQLAAATVLGAGVGAGAATVTQASLGTKVLGSKMLAILVGGLALGSGIWAVSPAHESAPRAASVAVRADENPRAARAEPAQDQAKSSDEDPAADPAINAMAPSPPAGKKSALKGQDARARDNTVKRQDSLIRESALLKQSRTQLKAGNTKAAQDSLNRLAAEFPAGVLGQEREVLAIALLSAEGQLQRAQQRARAFVTAHPQSPHSATLRELLERP